MIELTTMVGKRDESHATTGKIRKKRISHSEKNLDSNIVAQNKNRFSHLLKQYVISYVDLILPPDKHCTRRNRDDRAFDGLVKSKKTFINPPLCLLFISLMEIICYILNKYLNKQNPPPTPLIGTDSEGPVARYLIYNPHKRQECWRFLTYMMVHIGWMHLVTNLIVQLFWGVPLELRNQWWRVLIVYSAGVVAGSLVTSVIDPHIYLAGASSGAYALITAHVSNLILNWKQVRYAGYQLVILVFIGLCDISIAIYNTCVDKNGIPEGYPVAHFGGALTGILVGFWLLKNTDSTKHWRYLWWAAFTAYILLIGSAILLNIFWTQHFLSPIYQII